MADVPLLDEAAELLGEDDEPARRAAAIAASERQAEAEYARGVLEMTGIREVTAEELIDSYAGGGRVRRTAADNAIIDRTWTFGHVVVDEAQELSPMAWRLLMRRCPTRSMTVVGDLAQSSSAAGPATWAEVFDKLAVGRWSVASLTVNYRTPGPVMALAAAMLRAAGDQITPPRSAREGTPPKFRRAASLARLPSEVVAATSAALEAYAAGRVGVIAPAGIVDRIAQALTDKLPHGRIGQGDQALDHAVAVLTPTQAKGLEFDVAVVVEPATIIASGSRGAHDLYVALTRLTSELVVVHHRPLPEGM